MRASSTRALQRDPAAGPEAPMTKKQPSHLHTSSSKQDGGQSHAAFDDGRQVSKLEAEVLRLEARGTTLVQTEGHEIEGIDLLEKALRTRARFNTLNADAWQRAEQFVVVCNQLAVRSMQRLDDSYVEVANHLMAAAERALCNAATDPFGGFHPLRQSLLGSTLSNMAALTVLNAQPIEDAVAAVEKALAAESPRPSTLSLFNLAALYVRQGRFDGAMDMATKVIALADHYMRLHVNLTSETEGPFGAFTMEAASHAVLAHHLISSVASWSGQWNVAQHHAKLALRCAERYLGEHHALTTRAIHRAHAVATAIAQGKRSIGDGNVPPQVPLQMATFSSPYSVSRLLPFTLVAPFPSSLVDVRTDASNLPTIFNSLTGGGANAASSSGGATITGPRRDTAAGTGGGASLPAITRGSKAAAGTGLSTVPGPRTPRGPGVVAAPTGFNRSAGAAPAPPAANAIETARVRPPPATASGGGPPQPRPPAGPPPSKKTLTAETLTRSSGAAPAPPRGVNQSGRTSRTSALGSDTGRPSRAATTVTTITDLGGGDRTPPSQSDLAARDPVIEAWASPRQVTTVAKLDFEMYRQLQEEVAGYITAQAGAAVGSPPIGTASSATARSGGAAVRRRYAAGALGYSDADVAHAIAVSDGALSHLSEVRPDHTADDELRWDAAARKMQRWARLILARLALSRRGAQRDGYLRREDAADTIARAYRDFRRRTLARGVLEQKRRAKRLSDFFGATVEASARAWLSYAEYCRRVQAVLQTQLDALNTATRRTIAATGIQACWRSFAVRKHLATKVAMATRLQRFHRTFRAYLIVRHLVFARRTGLRATWKQQDRAALRIQCWQKHFIKQVRAIRERKQRLAATEEAIDVRVEREAIAWRRVAGVDEDMMAVRLQKFFSAIVWRKREHARQTTMRSRRGAASRIQRCWRWSKASTIRERKLQERTAQRATRRRIEEVTEAVLDMQRIARRFLARLEYSRRVDRRAGRHDAASILQRLVHVLRARKLRRERADEARWATKRYLVAAERAHAATKIQSVFRMHRDVAFIREYRGFMSVERHEYASRIQRAFRYFAARKVRHAMLLSRSADRETRIKRELHFQSILRIQHAMRSFLVRRATKRRAAVPVSRQVVAVSRIQRIVRYMIARAHVSRLNAAREHMRNTQRGDEHLASYAMVLQAAVRRRILGPKRIAIAVEARRVKAAIVIQGFLRRCRSRRQMALLHASKEADAEARYDAEEREFAAVRIQKTARAMLVRRRKDPIRPAAAAAEATTPTAVAAPAESAPTETAAGEVAAVPEAAEAEAEAAPAVDPPNQPETEEDAANRVAAQAAAVSTIARAFRVFRSKRATEHRRQARSDAVTAQLLAEQNDAAAQIQRSWRKRSAARGTAIAATELAEQTR